MTVSSPFFSPLRYFEKQLRENSGLAESRDLAKVHRPSTEDHYEYGAHLLPMTQIKRSNNLVSRAEAILRIIENFNSEPLFPGNGFILFAKTSRMFLTGTPLAASEAVMLLNDNKAIVVRLARVRPAIDENKRSVQIVPIADFNYRMESAAAFTAWWQTVGRNFCDGVF